MTSRPDSAAAVRQLEILEGRLALGPAEILEVPADASVIDACVAFASLATIHHPTRFSGEGPELSHRAEIAYQQLRAALRAFITQARNHKVHPARAPRGLTRDLDRRPPQ